MGFFYKLGNVLIKIDFVGGYRPTLQKLIFLKKCFVSWFFYIFTLLSPYHFLHICNRFTQSWSKIECNQVKTISDTFTMFVFFVCCRLILYSRRWSRPKAKSNSVSCASGRHFCFRISFSKCNLCVLPAYTLGRLFCRSLSSLFVWFLVQCIQVSALFRNQKRTDFPLFSVFCFLI